MPDTEFSTISYFLNCIHIQCDQENLYYINIFCTPILFSVKFYFTMFAEIFCFLINRRNIIALPKRFFLIVLALCCIVFSSASKKLIELKLAPYFTVSQALGKKIKDGSREKREILKLFVQSEQHSSDVSHPDVLFFMPALIALAFMFFGGILYRQTAFSKRQTASVNALPLYLHIRRIQV